MKINKVSLNEFWYSNWLCHCEQANVSYHNNQLDLEVRISTISKKKMENAHSTHYTEYINIMGHYVGSGKLPIFGHCKQIMQMVFHILSKWMKISLRGYGKLDEQWEHLLVIKGNIVIFLLFKIASIRKHWFFFLYTLYIDGMCCGPFFHWNYIDIVILLGNLDSWQWWCNTMNSLKFAVFLLPCCLIAFTMSYFVKVMKSNQQFIDCYIKLPRFLTHSLYPMNYITYDFAILNFTEQIPSSNKSF